MKINPGGELAPQDVVGRDELIVQLWRALERQSLVLTAERRMGKTRIIKKMALATLPDTLLRYRDLEQVGSLTELANLLYEDVAPALGEWTKAQMQLGRLASALGGAKLDKFTLPNFAPASWKAVLRAIFQALAESGKYQRVVFFWDEFPWLIEKIRAVEGARAAGELLDLLRAVRHEHPAIRFVLTGSIGHHHVLTALRAGGYNNPSFNDLAVIEVPPLSEPKATELAQALLDGEAVPHDPQAAGEIAKIASNIPFFIHLLVDRLVTTKSHADTATIHQARLSAFTNSQDPWNLRHFVERIPQYYGAANQALALGLLDIFASHEKPLGLGDVLDELAQLGIGAPATLQRERVRELQEKLAADHYLEATPDGKRQFRHGVLKAWWRFSRELG